MTRSPEIVTYSDLIKQAEDRLKWMEYSYPGKVLTGSMSERKKCFQIACQKALVKLLKKHKREPQGNLFEQFETIK